MTDAKPKKKVNRGANRGKMGRPRVEIDMEQLAKLCEIHCTLEETAGFFDCSADTIERRVAEQTEYATFAEYAAQHRGKGRTVLRRLQYQKAIKGDTKMLIWLGKQHLDQRDKKDIEQRSVNSVIVTRDDFESVEEWNAKYGADSTIAPPPEVSE